MEFAKKYALIPEDSLSKHLPSAKQITDFDKQMLQILNAHISDYEKVQHYYELLQKKLKMENNNLPWTTPANAEDKKMENEQASNTETTATKEDYSTMILDSVPKASKKQANFLLQLIKRNPSILQWNEKGEILYNGQNYPNSNLADLFHLIFTNRKRTIVSGKDEFLKALQELNVPEHYIKNKHLTKYVIKQEETSPVLRRRSEKKVLGVTKFNNSKQLSSVKSLCNKKQWLPYQ